MAGLCGPRAARHLARSGLAGGVLPGAEAALVGISDEVDALLRQLAEGTARPSPQQDGAPAPAQQRRAVTARASPPSRRLGEAARVGPAAPAPRVGSRWAGPAPTPAHRTVLRTAGRAARRIAGCTAGRAAGRAARRAARRAERRTAVRGARRGARQRRSAAVCAVPDSAWDVCGVDARAAAPRRGRAARCRRPGRR